MTTLPNVYLTGWEFNRLLQNDPLATRLSALPANVLWNSASLFWMFETVYVTNESLEGETWTSRELKWPSGDIFLDLESNGVISRVDLSTLRGGTKERIRKNHALLRETITPATLRGLVESGADKTLESVKQLLLSPALDELRCYYASPEGSLPAWFDSADPAEPFDSSAYPGADALTDLRVVRYGARAGSIDLIAPPRRAVTALNSRDKAR